MDGKRWIWSLYLFCKRKEKKRKERLIAYVQNQEEHHKTKAFKEEYIELLNEHGIEFDEKYLL